MSPHLGFFHAVFVLLVVSGSLKLIRPARASRAIRSARLLPEGRRLLARSAARLLGGFEVGLGLIGLLIPASAMSGVWLLAATSILFVGFNLFLTRLHGIDASADCGCFGSSERTGLPGATSGRWHRAVNAATALAAALGVGLALVSPGLLIHESLLETMQMLTSESLLLAFSYPLLICSLAWTMTTAPGLLDGLADVQVGHT